MTSHVYVDVPSHTVSPAHWRKSSHSPNEGGQCVEAGATSEQVAIRDSKQPNGPVMLVSSLEWNALLKVAKADHRKESPA